MSNNNFITLENYKGTNILKSFQTEEPSNVQYTFESIEKSLHEGFEKGLIDEELLEKSLEELDLIKGSNDPTHGGKLVPKHIINKQGKKQLVYVSKEEITKDHQDFKQGDKFKTKNGQEHEFVKEKGHDNKGGHLVTLKESKTGRIHDKYIHNLESVGGSTENAPKSSKSEEKQSKESSSAKNKEVEKTFDNKNVKYEITGSNYVYSNQRGGYVDYHEDYLIPILKDVLNKKFKIDGDVEIYSSPGYVNEQTVKFKTEEGENIRIKLRQGTNFGNYGKTHIVKAEMGNKTVSLSYYDSDKNGIEQEGENRDNYNKLKEISGENTGLYSDSNEKVTRYLLNEILKEVATS
jgi:hypothetical protein